MWMAVKYICEDLIMPSYDFHMIDLGFKMSWIVEYETIIIPIILLGACSTLLCLKVGKINYYIYWLLVALIPTLIFKYAVY